jgi:hypothetical protein
MLSLLSAWMGLAVLALALAMVFVRSLFADPLLPIALYGAALSMTLGGLVLWSHRKDAAPEPAVRAQRTQSKVGIGLSLAAVTIVYVLIAYARPIPQ